MVGWTLLGVVLLGLGGGAVPAAVALAVGGDATIARDQLSGSVSVVPLGVSLAGAIVFAVVLTSWPRVVGGAAAFVAGLVVLVCLPGGEFAVRGGATLVGGLVWLVVVVAVRVAMWWLPQVRGVVAVLLGAAGVATVVGVVGSAAAGARVLGTMVLAAPNLLCVALTRGLGVPWSATGPDLPRAAVDTGSFGPLAAPVWPMAVVAVVVVALVAVVAGWHTPWVVAGCFAAMAALGGAAVELRAGFFALELGVAGEVPVAAVVGFGAGLVGCLLVAGGRYWHRRRA
jgi:hypothetical protein